MHNSGMAGWGGGGGGERLPLVSDQISIFFKCKTPANRGRG